MRQITLLALGILFFSLQRPALAQQASSPPPYDEAALVKMAELGLDGQVVIGQLKNRSWNFEVNDALLNRLRTAGMPSAALDFLRTSSRPQAKGVAENLQVWVTRDSQYQEASLHSELWINAARVDVFAFDGQKPVSQFFKPGWNEITLKTTAQNKVQRLNDLKFSIGPVSEDKDGKPRMHPLFKFFNGSDWQLQNGRHVHKLGPDVDQVALDFSVYYQPGAAEPISLRQGDFVINSNADSDYRNTSTTVALWVNGQPVGGFAGLDRETVITPLLKKGRNEVKMVSRKVKNSASDNEFYISLAGHALFNRQAQKYEIKPIMQLQGMFGWERDQRTLELKGRADPRAEQIERVIPFYLEEDPQAQQITTDHALEPTFMVRTTRGSDYSEASLHSELWINDQLVDVFTSNTRKAVESNFKRGENVVRIKTTPQPGAGSHNDLHFSFGLASRNKDDELVMVPLWSFYNGTDWTFNDGRLVHVLGKEVKEHEMTLRLYFAGPDRLLREVAKGDYVLQAAADSVYKNTPVTVTVYVNGNPLNSFGKQSQQVVVTDLLKQGRNEIRVVSRLSTGSMGANDVKVSLGGPAKFELATQTYTLAPVLKDMHGIEGWRQNPQTLVWENVGTPGSTDVERTFTFTLDSAP
jgi:hypothetical protein